MSEKELNEKLIEKIKILNETVWQNKIKHNEIKLWLNNFLISEEKIQMLYLLSQFMYFSDIQIRSMLISLYRDLYKYPIIEKYRKENSDTLDLSQINSYFKEQLKQTKFIGIGESGESGSHLMYPFRQENKLKKSHLINSSEVLVFSLIKNEKGEIIEQNVTLKHPDVVHYVFLDDFCGSGSQAKLYSEDLVKIIKHLKPNSNISYLMLFGTKKGKKYVRDNTLFDTVDSIFELDESFECFSDFSRYYIDKPHLIDKDLSRKISHKYGKILMRDICELNRVHESVLENCAFENSHGFKNGQLLLGFYYNTPDNTLPIIWYGEEKIEWHPIFKRYNKIY